MEYKLFKPLKTRQVLPWEMSVIKEQRAMEMPPLVSSAIAVKGAVEFGWYDGDKPDVDELAPSDVLAVAAPIWGAYNEAMGFDKKKSQSEPLITQKE